MVLNLPDTLHRCTRRRLGLGTNPQLAIGQFPGQQPVAAFDLGVGVVFYVEGPLELELLRIVQSIGKSRNLSTSIGAGFDQQDAVSRESEVAGDNTTPGPAADDNVVVDILGAWLGSSSKARCRNERGGQRG